MRIAYLVQMAELDHENGIAKKIATQVRTWAEAGHVVRVFTLARTSHLWNGLQDVSVHIVTRGSAALRLVRSWRLCADLRNWLPDVIYFRYAYHSPGLPALFREIPTIAEINSDDRTEYALTLSRAKVLYHRITRARVLRSVAAFTPVTHELAWRVSNFEKPSLVLANGIALSQFASLPPPPREQPSHWVFLGSADTPWHGLDRVAELGHLFPDVIIDVVGCERHGDSPENLKFHGALPHDKYLPLMQLASIAVGTFGLYRKQMQEACPLKVREYLALGLPVLAAYRDTDIASNADYFLQLPNGPAPLAPHRATIARWAEHWRERRVPREAIAHLDAKVKEQQRLDFLLRFAKRTRSR